MVEENGNGSKALQEQPALALLLAAGATQGMRFDEIRLAGLSPGLKNVIFVLALLGFGSKAGLVPLHIWLPRAHPAAPSHMSAMMSGGMVNVLVRRGDPLEEVAEQGRLLLVADINSAVTAALEAGADELVEIALHVDQTFVPALALGPVVEHLQLVHP